MRHGSNPSLSAIWLSRPALVVQGDAVGPAAAKKPAFFKHASISLRTGLWHGLRKEAVISSASTCRRA